MPLEVDHAFIACALEAPEADALLRLGFVEGSSNSHPGQGTANRRFFFENFMLELLWVADPAQARSERTRRTRLWDRWSYRDKGANPIGIIFRSTDGQPALGPFQTWAYTPSYLPAGASIHIAEGTTLDEPELFYLPFLNRSAGRDSEPVAHALPIRRICGAAVGVRRLGELSEASRRAQDHGLLAYFESPQPVLEIIFEGSPDTRIDLRPDLPVIFSGKTA
ncbi:MAG: hypothetical protein QOK23_1758 [Gammaproteobacteria bacterium]|jgi:hypothetical protein|nr:hypothetical protein [Gammaproteobacteria bacterium]